LGKGARRAILITGVGLTNNTNRGKGPGERTSPEECATTIERGRGDRIRRRELLLLVGAAITTARTLHAQQKAMPVIGFLGSGSATAFAPFLAAFRQGLEQAGYVEGQNVTIEYRWAEGNFDRLPALAADLIGRKVDLILASGGIPSARAAKDARPRQFRSSSLRFPIRSDVA
jgi:hypothetical protein